MTQWPSERLAVWLLLVLLLPAACAPAIPSPSPHNQADINAARRSGHVLQALYLVEARATTGGWTPALLREAGDLWALAGDTARALDFWTALAREDADDVALARRLAQANVELQRWPAAADALDHLLALAPDDAWAHLQLGLVRIAFDRDAAVTHLRAAMAEPAYQPLALALINATRDRPGLPDGMAAGLVLVSLEQWPYAELAFRHAADVAAPYPVALAYTALARDRQGKPAEQWMADAVALAPDDGLIRYLQGLHLRAAGDNMGSLDALAQAVALDPENPAYHAELASAYRLLGELALAEYWLKSAVLVSDDDPRFTGLLARFYADEAANLTDDGLDALAQAAASSGGDADARAGFGWALYLGGRADDALAAFDAVLEDAPDNSRALYYKGRLLVETGEVSAGAELLRRVVALGEPWATDAQTLLDALAD